MKVSNYNLIHFQTFYPSQITPFHALFTLIHNLARHHVDAGKNFA